MIRLGRWFLRVFGLAVVAATLLLARPALHTDSVGWLLVRFVFMAIAFCCGVAIAIVSFIRVPGLRPAVQQKPRVRLTQDAIEALTRAGYGPPMPPEHVPGKRGRP